MVFVDADNFLELNCLEKVLLNDCLDQCDSIFWNYYRVYSRGKESGAVFQRLKESYSGEELIPYVLDHKGKQGLSSVCCRLFQKELIFKYELLF